jgi:hypothetical protein
MSRLSSQKANVLILAYIGGGLAACGILLYLTTCGADVALATPLAGFGGIIMCQFLMSFHGTRDIFDPISLVSLYFGVYFVLRGMHIAVEPDAVTLGFLPYRETLPLASWIALAGYLSLLCGYTLAGHLGTRLAFNRKRYTFSWPLTVPTPQYVTVFLIATGASLYMLDRGTVVGNFASQDELYNPVSGLPVLLERLFSVGITALCCSLFIRSGREMFEDLSLRLMVIAAVSLLLARLAVTGGKQAFLEPLIQALIVFHYLRRKVNIIKIVLIAVPALYFSFGVINTYRFEVVAKQGAPKSVQEVADSVLLTVELFLSGEKKDTTETATRLFWARQTGIDALALIVRYTPENRPYGLGQSYLQAPAQILIPREIWPNKPVFSPTLEFERDYMGAPEDFFGFTAQHFISDLYQNFHFFGVLGGLFLYGVFLYRCYGIRSNYGVAGVCAYAIVAPAAVHFLEQDGVSVARGMFRLFLLVGVTLAFLGVRPVRRRKTPSVLDRSRLPIQETPKEAIILPIHRSGAGL